ncbi:MAG: copper resistance CopC/CopD family protein [Actinomycetota bacterium]
MSVVGGPPARTTICPRRRTGASRLVRTRPIASRTLVGLLAGCILILWWSAPAGAHADLSSTDPENLSTVTAPVSEIRFTFTKPSEPVEERFSVEGPDGLVAIESVESLEGGTVSVLRLAEPADAGRYRVRWGIRAGDSHSMNGAISFTVASEPAAADAAAAASTTTAPVPTSVLADVVEPVAGEAEPGAGAEVAAAGLDDDTAPVAVAGATEERIADVLRGLLYVALLGAVGGVAYLGAVYRGPRRESSRLVRIVQGAAVGVGVLTVAGVIVEVVVASGGAWSSLLDPAAWTDGLSGGFGVATLLRLVGAVGVVWFVAGSVQRLPQPPEESPASGDPVTGPSAGGPDGVLVASGGTAVAVSRRVVRRRRSRDELVRVVPSPLAWMAAAALVASETFTGHTAVTEPRWLIAASDVTHLVAAAVWATGAVLLCWTFWQRSRVRPGDPLAGSVLRFSTLAGWALLAVSVTGVVQAGLILGSVDALVSTTFGRVLALKVVAVAAIAWTGWWNRRHLVPEFEGGTPSGSAVRHLRTSLSVEAVGFLIVVALTAVLVVSSPV